MLDKRYDEDELLRAAKAYLLAKRGEKREVREVLIDAFSILVDYEDAVGDVIASEWFEDGIQVFVMLGKESVAYYEILGLDALLKWYHEHS